MTDRTAAWNHAHGEEGLLAATLVAIPAMMGAAMVMFWPLVHALGLAGLTVVGVLLENGRVLWGVLWVLGALGFGA